MSSNSSSHPVLYHCMDSKALISMFVFIITKSVLVLPLSILVLYLWRQQRSFKTTSHSDVFTLHLAVMHVLGVCGVVLYFGGFCLPVLFVAGLSVGCLPVCGEILFHLLTCVDRYLAVVHPVTYLGLKTGGGVRIRDACVLCVWTLSCGWMCLTALNAPQIPIAPFLGLLTCSFLVVSFCSVSVLCVLRRPKPGDMGGARAEADPTKQRAFHTLMAITGVLCLLFVGYFLCIALDISSLLSHGDGCLVVASGLWFSLPSSLILPLLFLHRAGRPACCFKRTNSQK